MTATNQPTNHGYTPHGHPCCWQRPVGPRPNLVARCGGTHMCAACQKDAAHIHNTNKPAQPAAAVVAHPVTPTGLAEALAELEQARTIMRDLTDPNPCWYDHHGYCQAHGWMATDPACPHARAKAILEEETR